MSIPKPYKIKAKEEYLSTKPSQLSFCKDQVFYVIVEDQTEFLVSTNMCFPFDSRYTNGFVLKSMFEKVETKPPPVITDNVFKILRNRTVFCIGKN